MEPIGGDTMTFHELESAIYKAQDEVTGKWFKDQHRNPFEAYYLYHKPAGGLFGVFTNKEKPEGWELTTGCRISPAWNKRQAYCFIGVNIRRAPFLVV